MRNGSARDEASVLRSRFILNVTVVVAVGVVAHLFRSSVAVVAPDILVDFDLGTAWAAYLTSAFFITAVIIQIPAGMLFDSLGLRTTIPAMLCIAATGALVFAAADSSNALLAGRALMGVGAGALIMGGVVLCARWIPPERFPPVVGMVLSLAQIGNIGSTAPVAATASLLGWRGAFVGLAILAIAIAVIYLLAIKEHPSDSVVKAAPQGGLAESVKGSFRILGNRQLWPVFAMAFVSYAANFSIAGVWGGVYLSEVFGLSVIARGNMLLLMVSAFALGLFFFGWIGQKFGSLKHSVMLGSALSVLLFVLAAAIPEPTLSMMGLVLVLLGAAGGACGTIIPHGRNFYPPDSIGRGVTVLNTIVLLGAVCMQILTGLLMDAFVVAGLGPDQAFRALFGFHAFALAAGMVFYARARESARSGVGTAAV
jgi:predicted MFS family arabinose efflux permease